jgi:hypothetical protein
MEFTQEEIFDYVQRAVHERTGDDLERARIAFRGKSPKEMEKEWGTSGQSCQKILDGYVKERSLATAAMKWVCDRRTP